MPQRSSRPVTARIAVGLAALPIALVAAPALAAPALPLKPALPLRPGLAQHPGLAQRPGLGHHQQRSLIRQQEWWLGKLGVRQVWRTSEGSGITVAVLSDGVDARQRDLSGSVLTGPDYVPAGPAADERYFGLAGTAAASLIAGHGHGTGDWEGIMGVAPAARILSVQVTLSHGDPLLHRAGIAAGLPAAIADGIRYAVGQGASVIDLPLDPGQPGVRSAGARKAAGGSPAERAAVAFALRRGVVLVAPAGDDGASTDAANYPAAYPGVIAVGAFDQAVVKASYSSHQRYVTLTAAGQGVIAATPAGYETISSTAAASAIVAGMAALMKSAYPELTPAQVRQALIRGTRFRPAGGLQDGSGYGTADAASAMSKAAKLAAAIRRAGSQTVKRTAPTPPAVRPQASNVAPEVLKTGVMAAGLLVLLLLMIAIYAAAQRRRARQAAAGAAGWDRPVASAPSATTASPPDPLLAYFSSPTQGDVALPETGLPESGLPAAWRVPGGIHGLRAKTSKPRNTGPGTQAGPASQLAPGSHPGPGGQAGPDSHPGPGGHAAPGSHAGPESHPGLGSHAGPGSYASAGRTWLGGHASMHAGPGSHASPGSHARLAPEAQGDQPGWPGNEQGSAGPPGAGALPGARDPFAAGPEPFAGADPFAAGADPFAAGAEPHDADGRNGTARTARPALGPAPRPASRPKVSGTPPWEPAEKPDSLDSELPWATAPAPSAGNRLTRPGGAGQPASAASSPWSAAPTPPGGHSIWDSAAPAGGQPGAEQAAATFPETGQDQGSRPIYVWNPAASTDTFPAVPDSD